MVSADEPVTLTVVPAGAVVLLWQPSDSAATMMGTKASAIGRKDIECGAPEMIRAAQFNSHATQNAREFQHQGVSESQSSSLVVDSADTLFISLCRVDFGRSALPPPFTSSR